MTGDELKRLGWNDFVQLGKGDPVDGFDFCRWLFGLLPIWDIPSF